MDQRRAKIAFEDGRIFEGFAFGREGEINGEVVFNTSLSGYQEILTDPSYKGQIVTMTYPLIGNYGINSEDVESKRPFVEGFIIKERSKIASNWRSEEDLDGYLKRNNIMGIEWVDTRAITKHIRLQGALNAVISSDDLDDNSLIKKAKALPGLVGVDMVKEVTCEKPYNWPQSTIHDPRSRSKKVVVIDCGVKYNILRILDDLGCDVAVVPAKTRAGEILALKPDGIMLSNGPGDPAAVGYVVKTVKGLLGKVPIFGICLGHQMLGQALGGKTYKLKFGHHGGNQPVKDLKTGKIAITVQNHGFCVDMDTLKKDDIEITHMNLNDGTLEGIRHKKIPAFSVQFHPESSPGPHDAMYLFDDFMRLMDNA
jgi:carbamoyl-phosphate synthase small subunit